MIRAGLLRDILVFKELVSEQSPSGAVQKIYREVYRCKGYKRKNQPIADSDGINASEEFNGVKAVFQVRYSPLIKEGQRVRCRGREFSLLNSDLQCDKTYLLTLERVNE